MSRLTATARLLAPLGLTCAAVVAATAPATASTASEPHKVVMASSYSLPGAPTFIADAFGYFDEVGIDYEVVRVRSTSETIPLIARGEVDVATGSLTAGLLNAIGGGSDVRMVMNASLTTPGHPTWSIAVRQELVDSGEVAEFADLAGKRIGMAGRGTGWDMALAFALAEGGLTEDDVTIVSPIGLPDIATSMEGNQLDAAFILEPFQTFGQARGAFTVLWGADDIFGTFAEGVLMFSPDFVENEEAATAFAIAYLRAVRDYRAAFGLVEGEEVDPELRDRVFQVISDYSELPIEVLEQVTPGDLDPNGTINLDNFNAMQDFFVENGDVETPIVIEDYVDLRFQQAAVAELGES